MKGLIRNLFIYITLFICINISEMSAKDDSYIGNVMKNKSKRQAYDSYSKIEHSELIEMSKKLREKIGDHQNQR